MSPTIDVAVAAIGSFIAGAFWQYWRDLPAIYVYKLLGEDKK